MSGQFSDGLDWLPPGANTTTIATLMQWRGYYLRGSDAGTMPGVSLITGRWNYGLRFNITLAGGFNGHSMSVVKPINAHNIAGGFVSAGLRVDGTSSAYPCLGVYDLVNDRVLASVSFEANGVVKAYVGGMGAHGGGTFAGASDTTTFNMDTDFDAEAFFQIDNTNGEIEVRINTISVLHLTNIDTQPGTLNYFDSICWGHNIPQGFVANYDIDDFRYYDTDGSINNTWLGTCRVQTSLASGPGATTDFSISGAATNWQAVQNKNVDDTSYVYDPTVGDYDLYTIQPLVNSPIVFWAQVTSFVRQDDATQRFFKNRISSSGSIADGASYATSQTYTADSDIFELNPHTGLLFTGPEYNALTVGPLVYA